MEYWRPGLAKTYTALKPWGVEFDNLGFRKDLDIVDTVVNAGRLTPLFRSLLPDFVLQAIAFLCWN